MLNSAKSIWSNHSNAADGQKLLVLNSSLSATADLSRSAAARSIVVFDMV
jgi:hypothetical protein